MEKDGKHYQTAKASTTESSSGKIMLTLCTPSDDLSGYRHAVVPFPPSYEAACLEALKTFAVYIPADTEAVSLRQAVQRRNGQYVWCIIREDAWDTILEKKGEEIGVFLSDASPEKMGYEYTKPQVAQPPDRLVEFHFSDGSELSPQILKVVRSSEDCEKYATEVITLQGRNGVELQFQKRMVG
ncbi:hypothetical protein D9619_002278 [Psilocybe cf. subviscida]|uniref:Uncharacterized protein n=1 Tax=Psilocybe cf. subviscida TaxID=2480587 RepID=A0A8H5BD87_9AGAR|nr:hypothetical protein D9619_002278 [Psilocybe cf. subviscida]